MSGPRSLPDHRPSGFFVLRTPLLPVATHRRIGEGLQAAVAAAAAVDGVDSELDALIAQERAVARGRLREVLADPALRAAIAVASPASEAAIAGWELDPHLRRSAKAERALMRYVTRAAERPTPFGLFAGVSVGEVGERTQLALPGREDYAPAVRISLGWATELAARLAARPGVREQLVVRPNPTLYALPGRRRWIGWRERHGQRVHSLREMRDGPALELVLDAARDGATPAQLAERLVGSGRGSAARAAAFVARLVDDALLVADLAPPVTGAAEPDHELLARLTALPPAAGGAGAVDALRDGARTVSALHDAGLSAPPARWRVVREQLREIDGIELGMQPLTVELHKPARGLTIGPALIDELARGIEVLRRWQPPAPDPLHAFRAAFERRYGAREVPLAEALDDAAGVGHGVLLDPSPAPPGAEPRDRLLLARLEDALRRGAREIVVKRDDLDHEPPELPASFVVGARVAATSAAAIDRGDFRLWLKSARGPDAVGMFTRMSHASAELRDPMDAHLRAEQALDPDAVHAEIAHLPQLAYAPLLHRPLLRDIEIDLLGPSGMPRDRRLELADLLVRVAGDRVLLRSRRDGRTIVPRLGSALNIDNDLPPVFRLLVLLERQEGTSLGWTWGSLSAAPYHPRVRAGRTILAPARWRVQGDALRALQRGSDAARFRAVARMRGSLGLPRHVAVTDADNILPVDLDSTVGVDLLLGLTRGREDIDLAEVHPAASQLCVEGPEGRFAHELVVPFLARTPRRRTLAQPASQATPLPRVVNATTPRSFAPGSRWLYLKVYSGPAAADEILRRGVAPLCEGLAADGHLEGWFFVRYADPDPHLRVRLQLAHGPTARGAALARVGELGQQLLDRRLAWRTTLDTYEREVERYGGATGIGVCERWFALDSAAAIGMLNAAHEERAGPEARWRTALLATDHGLAAFGLDVAGRRAAMHAARAHRARVLEEAAGAADGRSFARRYGERHRRERAALEQALARSREGAHDEPLAPFTERADGFAALAAELHAADAAGRLTRPPLEICLSLVHMRINRLLSLGSPEPEVRLYDALERLYAAQLARPRTRRRAPDPIA